MKAIIVPEPGGPDVLEFSDIPTPEPGDHELLVRVHATALNRADLMQRDGKYPPPPGATSLLGLDVAGLVVKKGRACGTWNEGDRVFGLLVGGGYAEYALLHCDLAMPVPPSLSLTEAAAIPEVFLTAYQATHWYGSIGPGDRILVHAGASGVGTAAIQLAREAGACVYVTASARKHETCLSLGAERAIDYRTENFADVVLKETGGAGANVIVDFVGAPYFSENLRALAMDGRLILLATLGGGRIPDFDLREMFKKRAQVYASTLRARSTAYKAQLTAAFVGDVLPAFEQGTLKPVIDRVYPWDEVIEAHRRMEANENVGKIVLRVAAAEHVDA